MSDKKIHRCWNCGEEFPDLAKLNAHRKKSGHNLDTLKVREIVMENKKVDEKVEENEKEKIDPVDLHFDAALEEMKTLVGSENISPANVLLFALHMERVVEGYENIEGPQRKELIMKVFKEYLNMHGGDSLGIMELLPSFIDTTISLDKGETTIKINNDEAVNCCIAFLKVLTENSKKKK